MLSVIGIDQGLTATGIALCVADDCHTIKLKAPTKGSQALRITMLAERIRDAVTELIDEYDLSPSDDCELVIAREGCSYQSRRSSSLVTMGQIAGAIDFVMLQIPLNEYYIIPPSQAKKFVLGKGNIVKDDSYMDIVLQKTSIEFDTDHEADAYMIAQTAKRMWQIENVVSELSDSDKNLVSESLMKKKGFTRSTLTPEVAATLVDAHVTL